MTDIATSLWCVIHLWRLRHSSIWDLKYTFSTECFHRTYVPKFALSEMAIPESTPGETHENGIIREKNRLSPRNNLSEPPLEVVWYLRSPSHHCGNTADCEKPFLPLHCVGMLETVVSFRFARRTASATVKRQTLHRHHDGCQVLCVL